MCNAFFFLGGSRECRRKKYSGRLNMAHPWAYVYQNLKRYREFWCFAGFILSEDVQLVLDIQLRLQVFPLSPLLFRG